MQKKVAYCSPFIPPEWIAAHGLTPCCVVPDGNEKSGPIPNTEGVCAFMQCFVNELADDPDIAAVIMTTVCDQMRRGSDYVRMFTNKPVFLMHIPKTWRTVSAGSLYISELRRLGVFLQVIGGCQPSNTAILNTMQQFEELRCKRDAIRSKMMMSGFVNVNAAFLKTFQLPENIPENVLNHKGTPIALLGGPLCKKDFELIDIIEDAGGVIVLDGTEMGERSNPAIFTKRQHGQDPLIDLADAYFGTIPDVFRQPNSELFRWVKKEIVRRNVRGIVLLRYVWCDYWHSEVGRFREWLSIPLIDIDLDMERSTLRNKVRIQAFMESLQ